MWIRNWSSVGKVTTPYSNCVWIMSTAIKIRIGIGKPKLKFQRDKKKKDDTSIEIWESYNTIQCILSAEFLLQPSVVSHAPPLLFVLEPSPPPSAISLPYAPPTNSTMSPSTTPIGNFPSGATTLLLRLLSLVSFFIQFLQWISISL